MDELEFRSVCRIPRPSEPELRLLHDCFDSWRGSATSWRGSRQEYDLQLRRYNGRGWCAIFFLSGFEHSLTADAGSAWARSPWEAVQRAAADTLRKRDAPEPEPRDWTLTDESPR